MGADFRIFKMTPLYIPPLKNLWGIGGYTPLGFKGAYMLCTKIFFGGIAVTTIGAAIYIYTLLYRGERML